METKKEELERLYRKLYEWDKEYRTRKLIRTLLTISLFVAGRTFILYGYGTSITNDRSITTFFVCLMLSVFVGTIEYFIYKEVFDRHLRHCREEFAHPEGIRKEISEVTKKLKEEQMKGR